MAKYTLDMTEEELAEEIDTQFKFAKRYLDPIHERMNQQEELYRTFINAANYPHQARVFDPRVFRVIETITPRMVANEPTGSFYPTEKGDVNVTEILNALVKYDWRRAEMFPKQVNFIKSMLIFGTAFGRTYWDFREKEKTQMVAKKLHDRLVWTPENTKKIKVTEFDGPNFEVLNIYDCFPDPNSTSVDNMRWFIYRMFKTVEELEAENDARGGEYWKHLDVLKKAVDKKNGNRTPSKPLDMSYREHRRTMLSTSELHGEDVSNPEFTVLVRYTRDGWCFYVPEFASENFSGIIREVENPYFHGEIPIIHGVDYPYPGELYGMGEIEPIDRIQRAINAVLNQRLDNVQLTLRNMWKVKKNSGVDMHTLISAPGNIVTVDDMAAVETIDVPDVTGPTFVQTMNYLTSALQNGSGVTDYTTGIDNTGGVANKTATGARLIQQEANAQFKLKVQLYSHMVIARVANQWKDLRIQYTTEEQKLRIIGQAEIEHLRDNTTLSQTDMNGEEIVPGEDTPARLNIENDSFAFLNLLPDNIQPSIVGDYDFIPQVSSELLNDPIAQQENFFNALDRFSNPAWQQGMAMQKKTLNFEELTKKGFEKLNVGVDANNAVVDLPDPQQQAMPEEGEMGEEQINEMLGQVQDQHAVQEDEMQQALSGPGGMYAEQGQAPVEAPVAPQGGVVPNGQQY